MAVSSWIHGPMCVNLACLQRARGSGSACETSSMLRIFGISAPAQGSGMSADQFRERKLPAVMEERYEVWHDVADEWREATRYAATFCAAHGFKVRTVYTDPDTGAVEYQEGVAE